MQNDKGEEILLRTGCELGPFVKLCERLTDEELFALGCGTAFIDMAEEENEKREAYHKKWMAEQAERKAREAEQAEGKEASS